MVVKLAGERGGVTCPNLKRDERADVAEDSAVHPFRKLRLELIEERKGDPSGTALRKRVVELVGDDVLKLIGVDVEVRKLGKRCRWVFPFPAR